MEKLNLSNDARKAQRIYQKQWRAKNREKVKAITIRYWERKAQRTKEGDEK